MSHTLLNVVRHPGGKLRFGVINQEYLLVPRPTCIRISNLPRLHEDVIVTPSGAYYSNGSIFSEEINDWLVQHFPRTADDPIWLLKFEFSQSEDEHIFTFVEDSGFRKVSRRPVLLTPQGEQLHAPKNHDLSAWIWQLG